MTEDGHARLESGDGLVGVQRARRRDHDAVEVLFEQLVERGERVRQRRVRHCGDLGVGGDGIHARPADPADAEEAEPRACPDRAHGATHAFTNPAGRVLAASNASASRSSGNRCVSSGSTSIPAATPSRIAST